MEDRGRAEEEERKRREEGDRPTVREILETYLKHVGKTKKPGTFEIRQRAFLPFVNHPVKGGLIGEKAACDLTHQDVYDFLEHMETVPRVQGRKKQQKGRRPTTWGPGSQRNFLQGAIAAFNWAVAGEMLRENPLDRIAKPGAASRGADALLGETAAEVEATHQRILAASSPHWKSLLQALRDTGARPGELIAATAADFDAKIGAFVFRKEMSRRSDRFAHKTSRHRDRVIMLTGPTLETVKELAGRRPEGPLFRRPNGNPFTRELVIDRFMKLRRRLGIPGLTAYSYRHTWAQ
jgi:integrase